MNSFEELEQQLKRLPELEQSPRPEFVAYLDEKLQKEATAVKRRLRHRRILTHTATAAVVILLGSWVTAMPWQQPSPQASTSPADSNIASLPLDHPQEPAATTHVAEQPNSAGQTQTKAHVPKPPANTGVPEAQAISPTDNVKEQPPTEQYNNEPDKISPPLQIAQSYLNEMLGDESQHYTINTKQTDLKEGKIVFSRMIHGVPFYNDSYSVGVEHDTVSYFKFNRLPEKQRNLSQFPPPVDVLSEKEALKIIADTMQPVYRYNKNGALTKRYELDFPGYLDAKTGKMLAKPEQLSQVPSPKSSIPVKSQGKKLEVHSVNDAITLLQQEFGVTFDGERGTSPTSISYGKGSGTEYTWAGADKTITAQVSPNGVLTAYHVQDTASETNGSKRAPREDDVKKALEFLERYLDKKITAVGYLGSNWNEREIQYTFGAFVKGIPLKGRTYHVTLDQSGKVVGMEDSKNASKNPPLSFEAASREAAISEYSTKHKLELIYIWPKKASDDENSTDAPQLVYQQK
ncbi:YcdB/YcdC domain-containing protein [uncultured Brevibacillus sp.]|uniref:YcdB/YcdC domain-containing protein n=1 Tax=uncultured Brevibacillus sp. TaxID=169970 RepID=UPI00259246E4|nr:YcdB/YcdC domain-containing protein [uncultured Brevibacillus sp.]